MSRRLSIAEVKSCAIDRLEDILARLCPGGRTAGGSYTVRNPTRADRRAGSFVVYTAGRLRGAFVEFANRDEERGDVIDLVSYLLAGGSAGFKSKDSRIEAVHWIEGAFGLGNLPDSQRAAAVDAARHRQHQAEGEEAEQERRRQRAIAIFADRQPLAGSLAEIYLRTRGIDLAAIPTLTGDLAFLPAQEYWPLRRGLHAPGPKMPAMIGAFRNELGTFVGVHLTFLRADGSGKAKVDRQKLIWPRFAGAVIRLTHGESGRAPEEDAPPDIVIGVEGIEDGLTAAMAAPELRVWAAGALGNIGAMPALPCVNAWLIHRQNDWASRQATASFEKAIAQLAATGRPVAEFSVPAGFKDINDLVRG